MIKKIWFHGIIPAAALLTSVAVLNVVVAKSEPPGLAGISLSNIEYALTETEGPPGPCGGVYVHHWHPENTGTVRYYRLEHSGQTQNTSTAVGGTLNFGPASTQVSGEVCANRTYDVQIIHYACTDFNIFTSPCLLKEEHTVFTYF